MAASLNSDALLRSEIRDSTKLMERALLWLHEQEVVTLGKGLSIFRPAITVHLEPGRGQYTKQDFAPLEAHYAEQTLQTHVMAGYAQEGLHSMARADKLAEDYFALDQPDFLRRWMPQKAGELRRQTSARSHQMIVDALGHPVQEKIVADDREQTNMLVLAGPGSGKTRVLVHRVAYLIRVRRENPRGILVLSYNRHAAAEIRVRLRHLIGEDANGVTVSTCHALAMRLVGTSFAGMDGETRDFDRVVLDAARLLRGDGLAKAEAEAQREALIEGYRWILVDEYQDIGPEEYELIAAVAGRTQEDPDLRLSLFAVGDDDQNIYAFAGASIRYIRQFEQDYRAKAEYLVENFRSTGHIVAAANAVIAPAGERMKTGHDIVLNSARRTEPAGGDLAALDPVAAGRVQLLRCAANDMAQAAAALDEMQRLAGLDPDWSWARTAVIARNWKQLEPVRALAEARDIPVEMANESLPSIWRLRDMQRFIAALRRDPSAMLGVAALLERLGEQPQTRWTDLIAEGIAALADELADKQMPVPDLIEWFGEWARDTRGEQRGLLLLTAHRAKGLEFDHVTILDGGWDRISKGEDADAPRRLFYVAITRARRSLAVMSQTHAHAFAQATGEAILARRVTPEVPADTTSVFSYVMPEMSLGRPVLRRAAERGQPVFGCDCTGTGRRRFEPATPQGSLGSSGRQRAAVGPHGPALRPARGQGLCAWGGRRARRLARRGQRRELSRPVPQERLGNRSAGVGVWRAGAGQTRTSQPNRKGRAASQGADEGCGPSSRRLAKPVSGPCAQTTGTGAQGRWACPARAGRRG